MLVSALKAVIGIVVILGGWLLVQAAWRRVFPGTPCDEDVLASRIGCHDCPRDSSCDRLSCTTGDTQPQPTQVKG